MAKRLSIHPKNPQPRICEMVAHAIAQGELIVYGGDVGYAFAARIADKGLQKRIRQIRQLTEDHPFSILCKDLSMIASYAEVSNPNFRILRHYLPGPYTFILPASKQVVRAMDSKRKVIGVRIADNPFLQTLFQFYTDPILSSSLLMPFDDFPLICPDEIVNKLDKRVDLIADIGISINLETTIVDLSGELPQVLRQGAGAISL